jgi:hypothetical protein
MTRWWMKLRAAEIGRDQDWSLPLFAGILGLGLLLRAIAFHGFSGSDDRAYAELAHALAVGHYPAFDASASVFQNRIGLIAPVAGLVRALGTAEWIFHLYPFAISAASIALAFFFGRALFGTSAGLFAAGMIALLPIEMSMATSLVPDMAATFWANLGVFAVWRATQADGVRRALALGASAGLCFGIAWLHKVSIGYLAPFVGGALLVACWQRPRLGGAALLGTALASASVLLAESLSYLVLSGEAGFRFASLSRNFERTQVYWFVEGGRFGFEAGHYAEALLHRLFVRGPERIFLSRAYAHLPLTALLVCALAIRGRETRLAFCAAWFGSLLVLFNFATTSLDYYKPLVLFQRYLYPLVLPAALLISAWLVSLRRGGMREWNLPIPRYALALLICLPMLRGYAAGLSSELTRPPSNAGVREVAARFSPSDAMLTDATSVRDLELLWGYPQAARLTAFEARADSPAKGTLVFINRERLRILQEYYDMPAPAFTAAPPSSWKLIARVHEGEVYRVSLTQEPRRLGHR